MLTTTLNKLRELSRKERRLLFGSVLLLPVIHVALMLMGYSRLQRMMEKLAPLKSNQLFVPEAEYIQRARRIARMVSIAAQHGVYKATCLRRSLVVWWFLRTEGIPGRVCFGVRMSDRRLEAHAWVEYNGALVTDSETIRARYHPLHDALPGTERGL